MKTATNASTERPGTSDGVLVDPGWLRDHLSDPRVRVVEVDVSAAAYEDWHIDGAVLYGAEGAVAGWLVRSSGPVSQVMLAGLELRRVPGARSARQREEISKCSGFLLL